jgi:hypothetical protein
MVLVADYQLVGTCCRLRLVAVEVAVGLCSLTGHAAVVAIADGSVLPWLLFRRVLLLFSLTKDIDYLL